MMTTDIKKAKLMKKPTLERDADRGFTLVETIVVLGVIFVLAGILVPTVLKYIGDAQRSRAESDVRQINAAINSLIKDTGRFPGDFVASASIDFLVGPGTLAGTGWATSANNEPLEDHLLTNTPGSTTDYPATGRFKWNGSYLQAQGLEEDPWGNAYEVNVDTLVGGDIQPTWVISPGPDGVFQTQPASTDLSSDDIGVRIK